MSGFSLAPLWAIPSQVTVSTLTNSQAWPIFGGYAGGTNTQIVFSKTGRQVTVCLPLVQVTQTSANSFTYGNMTVPAAFKPGAAFSPATGIYWRIPMTDNGTSSSSWFIFSWPSNTTVNMTLSSATGGNLSGAGVFTQYPTSVTYFTDS
jgi:hypothetical protein